jgi:hypothetical protein
MLKPVGYRSRFGHRGEKEEKKTRPLPSETKLMLMLVRLKSKTNDLEERARE